MTIIDCIVPKPDIPSPPIIIKAPQRNKELDCEKINIEIPNKNEPIKKIFM